MSSNGLRLHLFFNSKVLAFVFCFGLLGYLAADHFVENVVLGIHFSNSLKPLEAIFQKLLLERGSRAIWLWTLLPANIAWIWVSKVAEKIEKLG